MTVREAMEIMNDFQTTAMTSEDAERGMTGGVGGVHNGKGETNSRCQG